MRVGVSISPEHYDRGWHITGTCGVIGCAVTAALLLGFDEAALAQAVSIAASMFVGQREAFGTMTKPYHPGKAAANGIAAARLAQQGAARRGGYFRSAGRLLAFAVDQGRFRADERRVRRALGTALQYLQAVSVRDRRASGDRRAASRSRTQIDDVAVDRDRSRCAAIRSCPN